jgi:hypothetical protein
MELVVYYKYQQALVIAQPCLHLKLYIPLLTIAVMMIPLLEVTESVLWIHVLQNDSTPLSEWGKTRKVKQMISGWSRQMDSVTTRTGIGILTALTTMGTAMWWDMILCILVHHYIF